MIGSSVSRAGEWAEAKPERVCFLATALVGLGTLLRIWSLGSNSLWLDEAIVSRLVPLGLGQLLATVRSDFVGLAYSLEVNVWARLLGESEFSLRLLSALPSILGMALIYQGAKRISGPQMALLGMLLMAISPLDIWYAQEVRMYAQATFLGLLCLFCYLRYRERERRILLASYALTAILGVYTLYSFPLILLLLNAHLGLLWLWTGEHPKRWGEWLLAQLVILAGFLPWAHTFLDQVGTIAANPGRWQFSSRLAGMLGRWMPTAAQVWWLASIGGLVGCLMLAALAFWTRTRVDRIRRLLQEPRSALLWGMSPYLGLIALGSWRPNSSVRQLAMFVPWTILATIASLRYLRRWRQWIVVLMVLPAMAGTAKNLGFTDKEGWRDTVAYVSAGVEERDLILTHAYYTLPAFNYYYHGSIPAHAAPRGRDLDGRLPQVAQGYQRVWLVLSHDIYEDPQGQAEAWFDAQYSLVSERAWQGVRVRFYERPASPP